MHIYSNILLLFFISCIYDFIWTASSEFGTYRLCEQRRFRRACASAQSRQNLRCSLIQAVSQEEPSDRKPDPWPLWMAGHAQLKFVMKECSKTQIRLTGLMYRQKQQHYYKTIHKVKLSKKNSINRLHAPIIINNVAYHAWKWRPAPIKNTTIFKTII